MTQRCLRITAAALTLAALLALPAQAASRTTCMPKIDWIEDVVRWVARVWVGTGQVRELKTGIGIDPNGSPSPPPSGFGAGISPNGALSDTSRGINPNG
jgi:hypothetical protein